MSEKLQEGSHGFDWTAPAVPRLLMMPHLMRYAQGRILTAACLPQIRLVDHLIRCSETPFYNVQPDLKCDVLSGDHVHSKAKAKLGGWTSLHALYIVKRKLSWGGGLVCTPSTTYLTLAHRIFLRVCVNELLSSLVGGATHKYSSQACPVCALLNQKSHSSSPVV